MRGDPAISFDDLLIYYRGVYFASVALKGRLAQLGPDSRAAVREVGHFQRMVKTYWDALSETAELRDSAQHPADSP